MKKEIIIVFALVFLAALVIADDIQMSVTVLSVDDKVITVCSSGCDYIIMQDAVDAAGNGDTVFVYNGVYSPFNFTNKNNISIEGQDKDLVIINGDGSKSLVVIENTNNSFLTNLTLYNGWHGVWLGNSNNNTISYIKTYNNTNEGFLLYISNTNYFYDVESYKNGDNGIYVLNSENNSFVKSKIYNNSWIGLSAVNGSGLYVDNLISYYHNKNETWSSGLFLEGSSFCVIKNLTAYSNTNGLYLYTSNNNTINNSNLSTNQNGIRSLSENNIFGNNVFYDNYYGINYTAFVYSTDTRKDNVYLNRLCDVAYLSTCLEDYTSPGAVSDLTAYSGGGVKEVILNWTAVGDNGYYGAATKYIVKYSNVSEVNDYNWSSVTDVQEISDTSVNGTKVSHSLTMPNYGTYWFVVKAQDDASPILLNSTISNSASAVSPYHELTVDSIVCVNAKNGYDCNATTSVTYPTTNYLYDIFNISGNITNNGNVDETELVEVKREWNSITSTVDSKNQLLLKGQTTFVNCLDYNISDINLDISNYLSSIGLFVAESPPKEILNARVWSIKDDSYLNWSSDDSNPPSDVTSSQIIIILANVWNNLTDFPDFYDIPTIININSTFSVNTSKSHLQNYCDVSSGNKTCYVDATFSSFQSHWWRINPLPVGVYNISIRIGNHPMDQIMISRIVNVNP